MSYEGCVKRLKVAIRSFHTHRVNKKAIRKAFLECRKEYNKNWDENVISDNGILRVINTRNFCKRERQLYHLQNLIVPFVYPIKHKTSAVKK